MFRGVIAQFAYGISRRCGTKKSCYSFQYRIRNRSDYNQVLIGRGRITFWFDEEVASAWRSKDPSGRPGTPSIYSTAIHGALVLKEVFHLSLRATQGFRASLVNLMELDFPMLNYSTLSRRQGKLAIPLLVSPQGVPRHVVIDSTGLRVFGEDTVEQPSAPTYVKGFRTEYPIMASMMNDVIHRAIVIQVFGRIALGR